MMIMLAPGTTLAQGKADRERDFITVRTDHPKARVVTIPVYFATRRGEDPTAGPTASATEAR